MRTETIIVIIILFCLVVGWAVGYSTYGAPTKFGNDTTTTCYLGGDTGILNCTGILYITGISLNGSLIDNWGDVNVSDCVEEEVVTISVSGGSGLNTSNTTLSKVIYGTIVTPTTNTTTYYFTAKEHTSQRIIDQDSLLQTGERVLLKQYPIYKDTIDVSIANSSVDETFTVRIRYS